MKNQLTRGLKQRLMYFENKDGDIDGVAARIGWATFSKTGRTVFYRGRELIGTGGEAFSANYMDAASGERFWVSGVKQRGSNVHWASSNVGVVVDADAAEAYAALKASR
jgi:hypothetical protein